MTTLNKHNKLVSWARSHGAVIPDTLIFPSSPYGHCLTTAPIPQGTRLFEIPHSLIITPDLATNALPSLKHAPVHARMCAFIALERTKKGFWKDYFETLPTQFTTPPYFNEDELGVLEGTNLSFAWKDRVTTWKQEFQRTKVHINNLEW
jgi:N-lysine methyltransferase SETD6